MPTSIDVRGTSMWLRVYDKGATYPLTIDPMVQEASLGGGAAVALSQDGNTALVGAEVFSRSGSTWTLQATLTPDDATGQSDFGASVALSADGNTALIGGPQDGQVANAYMGAAWVFTRSNGTWSQQGPKLVGSGAICCGYPGGPMEGTSVALSGDGNTALVGAPGDVKGSVWVFARSNGTWSQQGSKLSPGAGGFGWSLALSGDGNTALVDARSSSSEAFVFTRSGSTWTQQGPALTIASGSLDSVSLSSDGNTALLGGVGAAEVLTRSDSLWTQSGPALTPSDASGEFVGSSVALSGDGTMAVIGDLYDNAEAGAVWLFARLGSSWSQVGAKTTVASSAASNRFGDDVAMSGDGTTALISSLVPSTSTGSAPARVFDIPPVLGLNNPGNGSYTNQAKPTFGGTAATRPGDSDSVTIDVYPGLSASGTPIQTLPAQVGSDGSYSVEASPSLADGSYTAQAQQSDAAGNVGYSSADTFTVDTVPPNVSLTSPIADSYTNHAQPSFSGTGGQQPGDSGTVTVDVYSGSSASGPPVQSVTGAVQPDGSYSIQSNPGLVDGQYTARAQQSDAAGNVGHSSVNTFTVDTTPPAAFSNIAPANSSRFNDPEPTLEWNASSDSGSGLGGYRVFIDGVQIGSVPVTGPMSYTPSSGLSDGSHSWQVVAFDKVGNVQSGPVWTFVVDTRAPNAAVIASSARTVTGATETFDASGSVDPEGAAFSDYSWDPTGSGVFTSSGATPNFTYAYQTPGTYTATVRVTNAVGLTGTASATVTVEPAPPPGNVGVVINNGDYATNNPHVQVGLVWPPGAGQVLISNNGGFGASGNVTTFPLSPQIPWTLQQTGSDRLPKTIYLRFLGAGMDLVTFTDDIILDELAPTVQSAQLIARGRTAMDVTTARAAGGRHRYAIRLKARDRVVGICAVEASSRRSGGAVIQIKNCRREGVHRLARIVRFKLRNRPRYLRVLNSAGTWSRWHKLTTGTHLSR